MSESPDSPSHIFGDELAQALDRAVGTSLDSLILLREAVRSYTGHQKSRGVPLDRIMVALGAVLIQIEDDKANDADTARVRDPELARQIRAWCSADFSGKHLQ